MKPLLNLLAVVLLAGMALAQTQSSSGTMNSLSTNPRQNQELTNSTGTESGQPSDAVPGSEDQPNGLVPQTTNMVGSGSNGNMSQPTPGAKPPTPSASEQNKPTNPATDQGAKSTGKSLSQGNAASNNEAKR